MVSITLPGEQRQVQVAGSRVSPAWQAVFGSQMHWQRSFLPCPGGQGSGPQSQSHVSGLSVFSVGQVSSGEQTQAHVSGSGTLLAGQVAWPQSHRQVEVSKVFPS